METVEIRLRMAGSDKDWDSISPNIWYRANSSKVNSTYVNRVISALYPVLAVCEVRWNIAKSERAHFFEYRNGG